MKSESGQIKKLKRPKSVNFAMWGYFCLSAIILVFILEIVFYLVVASTFSRNAKKRVERIGIEAVQVVENHPDDIEKTFIIFRNDGINVYLIGADGSIIFPSDPIAEKQVKEGLIDEFKSRLAGGGAESGIIFSYGGSVNYAEIADYNGQNSYVLATYPLAIVRETVKTLQIYLIIVGVLVVALSFLISYLFSQKLTRGLKNMSDTAVKLAEGDYSVKFANADYEEMAQLSDALNYVRDEVKKSEDFRREILANVTHDLKTPLTMIKAYASMIKEISGDNKEKREKHLQVIIDEADRLTGLVNDVLSVSKIQSNLDEINPKVFNLTELTYGIINQFGYLQEAQGYTFMVDMEQNLYTRADAEKIKQVIYNLLGNAANYTGADKTVYISLNESLDGKRIRFSVRDTGKGIAKENLPEIWDRYYRVNENHNRPVKGTGLGLNIVKVILQNHSFDFGVESKIGEGSTFWVDFPSVPSEIDENL